ncbi:MAG: YggS family pyridoxal phosphate-dependent enzyme [Ignavibacteriales bacterium]|nr:MAG: YggS family pyridoxal phosphate-dependent enzyme [Ignavibacteriales bacterium]
MITENIKLIRGEIHSKCVEIGRNPEEIKLIAVSKNFGPDDINKAFEEGLREFGENKAQELDSKFNELGNKITWHFIGHLQKNKVKLAVRSAEFIHSVDSLSLAIEINKRAEQADKIQKVLLQVKTSEEETKSGIETEEELFKITDECKTLANIEVIGLMTIAPFTDDVAEIRKSFRYLRKLKDDLIKSGFKYIKELSMGMTSDYKIAIEEGATMLRIGSAIFGQRDYSKK